MSSNFVMKLFSRPSIVGEDDRLIDECRVRQRGRDNLPHECGICVIRAAETRALSARRAASSEVQDPEPPVFWRMGIPAAYNWSNGTFDAG